MDDPSALDLDRLGTEVRGQPHATAIDGDPAGRRVVVHGDPISVAVVELGQPATEREKLAVPAQDARVRRALTLLPAQP